MSQRHSRFVTWLLLTEWKGDHVVFVDDGNSSDYGEEFYAAKDMSEQYWNDFKEFIKDNAWYFSGGEVCYMCEGRGKVRANKTLPNGNYQFNTENCDKCNGTGRIIKKNQN